MVYINENVNSQKKKKKKNIQYFVVKLNLEMQTLN